VFPSLPLYQIVVNVVSSNVTGVRGVEEFNPPFGYKAANADHDIVAYFQASYVFVFHSYFTVMFLTREGAGGGLTLRWNWNVGVSQYLFESAIYA